MHISDLLVAGLLVGSAAAGRREKRTFTVPSENGFPTPNEDQLRTIQLDAEGRLPDRPYPTSLSSDVVALYQVYTFLEQATSGFFAQMWNNVTNNDPGYEIFVAEDRNVILEVIDTAIAQEQVRALRGMSILSAAGAYVPEPCVYGTNAATYIDAVDTSQTLLTLATGFQQNLAKVLAREEQYELLQQEMSIAGPIGEESGFFRANLFRLPNEGPFTTYVPAVFMWSYIRAFGLLGGGHCDWDLNTIAMPVVADLRPGGRRRLFVPAEDQDLLFQVDWNQVTAPGAGAYVGGDGSGLYLTWIVGQLEPFSVSVNNVTWNGRLMTFFASFPFTENVMSGTSIAALTTTNTFDSVEDIVDSALAGPGIVQCDYSHPDSVANSNNHN
ncbi:hypothetical protein B0I35DRAFT_450627 [Stachybotrys elegans]|uniref:Uncharacterized protein n=1 Tax=Stachybotrys elegans TaxID=80388 RepID=A0A8K0WS72_9HYPO|nr:hypothetical protein B0I35DRAFT_450627 [Stachybotrys elegans]